MLQLANPKVAQLKPGGLLASNLQLVLIPHPARMPDGPVVEFYGDDYEFCI